jgi:signal transduction histidine kinase
MLTKLENDSFGFDWFVNWEDFEKTDKTINSVHAILKIDNSINIPKIVKETIEKISNKQYTEELQKWNINKGTILKIQNVRDDWSETMLNTLYVNLQTLIPPKEEKEFKVLLYSLSFPKKYGEVESSVFDDFDYKLEAEVIENKQLKVTIDRQEFDLSHLDKEYFFNHSSIKDREQYSPKTFGKEQYSYTTPMSDIGRGLDDDIIEKIGRFKFVFYFIKSSRTRGGKIKFHQKAINSAQRKEWMQRFGGVRLYRDGFRVRPYGEPKSSSFDWLELGVEAGKATFTPSSSGWRVRPNMVAGVVHISRLNNKFFEDKSNREGIQENQYFSHFKEVLVEIVREFERDRYPIMKVLDDWYKENNKSEILKKEADNVIKKLNNIRKAAGNLENKRKKDLIETIELIDRAAETITKAYAVSKDEIKEIEIENKVLRALASTGLIVTAFTHELKTIKNNLDNRVSEVIEIIEDIVKEHEIDLSTYEDYENPLDMLNDIKEEDARLKQWLDFAIDAIRKDKRRRRNIELVGYFNRLHRNWKMILETKKVNLSIDTGIWTEVMWKGFTIDLDSIFNNLIVNSTEAFKRFDFKGKERNITIYANSTIKDNKDLIEIIYEDSGPGIDLGIRNINKIFEFNFSTKRDSDGTLIGTGLGMWIVESIVIEYKGEIEITKARQGFKLKITLPIQKI